MNRFFDALLYCLAWILRPLVKRALEGQQIESMRIVHLHVGTRTLEMTNERMGFSVRGTLDTMGQMTLDPATGRMINWNGADQTVAWLADIGGGGLGPGTVSTLARFDATTTDVEDSDLSQDGNGIILANGKTIRPVGDDIAGMFVGEPGARWANGYFADLTTGDLNLHDVEQELHYRLYEMVGGIGVEDVKTGRKGRLQITWDTPES